MRLFFMKKVVINDIGDKNFQIDDILNNIEKKVRVLGPDATEFSGYLKTILLECEIEIEDVVAKVLYELYINQKCGLIVSVFEDINVDCKCFTQKFLYLNVIENDVSPELETLISSVLKLIKHSKEEQDSFKSWVISLLIIEQKFDMVLALLSTFSEFEFQMDIESSPRLLSGLKKSETKLSEFLQFIKTLPSFVGQGVTMLCTVYLKSDGRSVLLSDLSSFPLWQRQYILTSMHKYYSSALIG